MGCGYLGSVYCNDVIISGVLAAPITDKKTNKDITSFGHGSVRRHPTVEDVEFSLTFTRDIGDAGQNLIRDSKSAKTRCTYHRYISQSEYYILDAFVDHIAHRRGPKQEVQWEVVLSPTSGALFSIDGILDFRSDRNVTLGMMIRCL
jgi:hypothetical protein